MSKPYQKHLTRTYFNTAQNTDESNQLQLGDSSTRAAPKTKKSFKPISITKREQNGLLADASLKHIGINGDTSNPHSKNRSGSNKSNSRKRLFNNVPGTGISSKAGSRNNGLNPSSRERSATKRPKIKKNHKILPNGWTKISKNSNPKTKESSNSQAELASGRLILPTQVPSITRKLVSNTANSNGKPTMLDNVISPKNATAPLFERSNTNVTMKQHLYKNGEMLHQGTQNIDHSYSDNLTRAHSEIRQLRQELKMRNTELLKLKNLSKIQQKCKTPQTEEATSPQKRTFSSRRSKLKSRAKTVQQANAEKGGNREGSNSQSDEYYETTKLSPTSSYSNSVYSKGIPHIKSSQS